MHSSRFVGLTRDRTLTVSALLISAVLSACGNSGSNTEANATRMNSAPPVNNRGLWIANGTNVLEYLPTQLAGGTGAPAPHLTNGSGAFGAPQGVTFDPSGNLWVMDPAGMVNGVATPALFEFSASQLSALDKYPNPQPLATITSSELNFPQQSVFDANGNQWVSDHNNNIILVFAAAQLAQTGTHGLTPVVTITSGAFNGPLGITFDSSGNLWVANNGGVPAADGSMSAAGTTIVEFLANHLPAVMASETQTPELTPDVILSDDEAGSIQAPWALTFDAAGDLWSSNANAPFTLVEFAKTSLNVTDASVPTVTIRPTTVDGNATLNAPNGICFDNIGDLAAMNSAGAFGVAFFDSNQRLTSAAPVPNTFIIGAATTLNAPAGCNFGPSVN